MPQATFLHDGAAIDHTPGSALAAGDVVVQGDLVAIAKNPIAANALGALATEGVFRFTKPTGAGTDSAAGTLYYWDDTNNVATEDAASGANKLIGVSVAAVTTTGTTVDVMLRQR